MKRRDALVKELESGESLSARELASRLGVSRSTIVRDVAKLRETGVPIRIERGGYALAGPESVKRAVDRALRGRNVLRLEYVDGKNAPTVRDVEPSICLGGRGGHWYLVAWCRLRDDVRVFRLDRIFRAEVLGERFPEPDRDHPAEPAETAGSRPGRHGRAHPRPGPYESGPGGCSPAAGSPRSHEACRREWAGHPW